MGLSAIYVDNEFLAGPAVTSLYKWNEDITTNFILFATINKGNYNIELNSIVFYKIIAFESMLAYSSLNKFEWDLGVGLNPLPYPFYFMATYGSNGFSLKINIGISQ